MSKAQRIERERFRRSTGGGILIFWHLISWNWVLAQYPVSGTLSTHWCDTWCVTRGASTTLAQHGTNFITKMKAVSAGGVQVCFSDDKPHHLL